MYVLSPAMLQTNASTCYIKNREKLMQFGTMRETFNDVPKGYRVKLIRELDDNQIIISLFLGDSQQERIVPRDILDTSELKPKPAQPNLTPTHTYKPSMQEKVIFTDEGVTISCTCGKITRKVLSASIRQWEYENAAIASVKAMCAECSK